MTDISAIPATVGETYLDLPSGVTFEEAAQCGRTLWTLHEATPWMLGDWFNAVQDLFPQTWPQMVDDNPRQEATLRKYGWMCRSVPRGTRRPTLSPRHHELVAALPPEEREKWLDEAEPERPGEPPKLSTRALDKAMKQGQTPKNVETVERCACPECGSVFELSRASTWTEER